MDCLHDAGFSLDKVDDFGGNFLISEILIGCHCVTTLDPQLLWTLDGRSKISMSSKPAEVRFRNGWIVNKVKTNLIRHRLLILILIVIGLS